MTQYTQNDSGIPPMTSTLCNWFELASPYRDETHQNLSSHKQNHQSSTPNGRLSPSPAGPWLAPPAGLRAKGCPRRLRATARRLGTVATRFRQHGCWQRSLPPHQASHRSGVDASLAGKPHGMAFQVPLTQAVQARESTRHPDRMAVWPSRSTTLASCCAAMFVLTPTRAGR